MCNSIDLVWFKPLTKMTNNQLSIRLEPELKEKARRLNLPLRQMLETSIRLYDNTLYVKYYDLAHTCKFCKKIKDKIELLEVLYNWKGLYVGVVCKDCLETNPELIKVKEIFQKYKGIPFFLNLAKAFGYKGYKFEQGLIQLPTTWYNQARALYGLDNPSKSETDETDQEETEENEEEPNEL